MVLASSVDSINIGQQIRKSNPSIPILSGACGIAQRDLVQQFPNVSSIDVRAVVQ